MNNFKRGEEFSKFVALELKGRIIAQGFTAKAVAAGIGKPAATLNRWLNNKLPLPISILCEVAEFIGVFPADIVSLAYDRLAVRYGEMNGTLHEPEDADYVDIEITRLAEADADAPSRSNVIVGGFGKNVDVEIPENVEEEWAGQYAADPAGDDPIDNGTP